MHHVSRKKAGEHPPSQTLEHAPTRIKHRRDAHDPSQNRQTRRLDCAARSTGRQRASKVPTRTPIPTTTYLYRRGADGHERASDVGDGADPKEGQQSVHSAGQGVKHPAGGVYPCGQSGGKELHPHREGGVAVLGPTGASGREGRRGRGRESAVTGQST
jgi:hypothetical protein